MVPDESPPSWPLEALKAQAVAARTYAVATMKPGAGFDLYPDTRSQVYGGVAAEEASTNQAIAETRGEVVTYNGVPVVTYFFSTSGGRTEDVENTPLGNEPRPWLKSVDDPYDDASPRHRWGPIRMTLAQRRRASSARWSRASSAASRSCSAASSPRIVEADVIGSRGRTRVTGGQLRARFGLFDTWAFFTSITHRRGAAARARGARGPADRRDRAVRLGRVAARRTRSAGSTGRVLPVLKSGTALVQRRDGTTWVTAGTARVRRGGRYAYDVTVAGRLPGPVPRRERPRRPRLLISRRHLRLRRGAGRLRGDLQPRARGPADRDRHADDAGGVGRAFMGRSWKTVVAYADERGGLPEGFRRRYLDAMFAAFEQELRPVPGIAAALDAITLPNCVASSASVEKMRFTLGHTGLWDRFEGRIFSATEVEHGKPAPDLFLHAAAHDGLGARGVRRGRGLARRRRGRRCGRG